MAEASSPHVPVILVSVRITSAVFDPALLDLPWTTPLEEWPEDRLVLLPRGISRHVVRFVRLNSTVYAVKETGERVAGREYDLLRALERIGRFLTTHTPPNP